jgi:hypothetical protein
MAPGRYDLALYRGDSYAWTFRLWEDTGRTDPTDLTGATAAAELRDKPNGAVIVTLGCVITLPNIISVELPADSWPDLPVTLAAWDLELTYAATGQVHTVVAGSVAVTPDVTGSTVATALLIRRPAARRVLAHG